MAKVSVNLDDELEDEPGSQKLRELAAPLPSVEQGKIFALRTLHGFNSLSQTYRNRSKEALRVKPENVGLTKERIALSRMSPEQAGSMYQLRSRIDGRRR